MLKLSIAMIIIGLILFAIGSHKAEKHDYHNDVGLSIITGENGNSWVQAYNTNTGEEYTRDYVLLIDLGKLTTDSPYIEDRMIEEKF